MISFRTSSHRFHYRVGALVVHDEHVLLHRLQGDEFWAIPGGRVNAGEVAAHAVAREFHEELGIQVECGELLTSGENFFSYEGEPHHEVGLYFAVNLPQGSELLEKGKSHWGVEGNKKLEFRWFRREELPQIDLRPLALRQALCRAQLPKHFVQEV
jgi:ADP-ribose pyrophosphatase YjhB (NUDIX family)